MDIGYRRFCGAIGVTEEERGTRGLWWEKRLALWKLLESRGHRIIPLSRYTPETELICEKFPVARKFDLLIIEFGGTNRLFYGEDIDGTIKLAKSHKGPVLFICDDPELMCRWSWFGLQNHKNWTLWMNTPLVDVDTHKPKEAPAYDFPFGSLLEMSEYSEPWEEPTLAYIGRPFGRKSVLEELMFVKEAISIHSTKKEWENTGWDIAGPPPAQPKRNEFYRQFVGGLVLSDKRHKKLQWRTGRFYHAVAAGIPVVFEAGHKVFSEIESCAFSNGGDLLNIYEILVDDEEARAEMYLEAAEFVVRDKSIIEETLEATGL